MSKKDGDQPQQAGQQVESKDQGNDLARVKSALDAKAKALDEREKELERERQELREYRESLDALHSELKDRASTEATPQPVRVSGSERCFQVQLPGSSVKFVLAESQYHAIERYNAWMGISANEHKHAVSEVERPEDLPAGSKVICLTGEVPLYRDPRFKKGNVRISRINPSHDPDLLGKDHVEHAKTPEGVLIEQAI